MLAVLPPETPEAHKTFEYSIIDRQIVSHTTPNEAEKEVRRLIDDGWYPKGPLYYVEQEPYLGYRRYTRQNMVKFSGYLPFNVTDYRIDFHSAPCGLSQDYAQPGYDINLGGYKAADDLFYFAVISIGKDPSTLSPAEELLLKKIREK